MIIASHQAEHAQSVIDTNTNGHGDHHHTYHQNQNHQNQNHRNQNQHHDPTAIEHLRDLHSPITGATATHTIQSSALRRLKQQLDTVGGEGDHDHDHELRD